MRNLFGMVASCFLFLISLHAQADHHFEKVVMVVFENTSYLAVMQNPTMKKIADQGALFTHFFAETHPSQGNYVAMISGSTQGVSDDGNVNLGGSHIGDSLEAQGRRWHTYAEGFPGNCFLGSGSGLYARKHNPFMSFSNVSTNPSRCANITDDASFKEDWKSGHLADYNLWIPNLVNDGHDGGIPKLQAWTQNVLRPFLDDALNRKDILFVITFDEDDRRGRNQVYTVALGAGIVPGTLIQGNYNHVDLLGMIQSEFVLGLLPHQIPTLPVTGLWP